MEVTLSAYISVKNSTYTALGANGTFTGQWENAIRYAGVIAAAIASSDCVMYIDFSPDGINVDSTLTYNLLAGVNDVHRVSVTRQFFRIRVVNGSTPQTYLRLQTSVGPQQILSSSLNSEIQQDADAITTRTIDPEIAVASGLFQGYEVINKFGRNPSIDTNSVPEDVWNGGGVYTGFPTTGAEEFEVLSTSASDTGVLTFTYLASPTSREYQVATVTLNGTTPVATGVTGYRMHTARYESGSSTGFNVGEITLRHRVTTANIFCKMPIGRSQTNVSGFTVPFGSTGYIKRLFCRVTGATTGTVDGALWVRTNGGSPRLRRPFSAAQQDHFEEGPYGGIPIAQNSDIIVRITASSANNLGVIAGYDIVLVKN